MTVLAETSIDDESLIRKASGYMDAFNSYVRALHSVSADARWTGIGTELRGIGSRVDSVIYRYNRLDTGYEDIPTGYAKMAGRVLAYVAEEVMQAVQGTAVKNIVIAGDTLVAVSCDSLMDILRSDAMDELIRHEKESLRDNYSAYLRSMELRRGTGPSRKRPPLCGAASAGRQTFGRTQQLRLCPPLDEKRPCQTGGGLCLRQEGSGPGGMGRAPAAQLPGITGITDAELIKVYK